MPANSDPRSGFYRPPLTAHAVRAEELLEKALSDVRDRYDAIPTVSEALANLRAEVGELPDRESAELLNDNERVTDAR
jgi:hypothetical protein